MTVIRRRTFVKGALASSAALFAPHVSRAQDWPNRPIRFIVPLAAGGGLDFIARLAGEYVSRNLGQQVIIENRTGGGGTIGIDAAIKSAPDGYSYLLTNDNVASAPHVLKLNVDFLKDLVPVSLLGLQPTVLAVHPSFEANSVAELVAAVKKSPGTGCATSGVGSNQHVLMEWFNKTADIKLDHVPYRGAGQAINDLVAGHVKVAFLGPTATLAAGGGAEDQAAGAIRRSALAEHARPADPAGGGPQGHRAGILVRGVRAARHACPRSSRGSMPNSTRRCANSPRATPCSRPRPRRSAARTRSSPSSRARTPTNMRASCAR